MKITAHKIPYAEPFVLEPASKQRDWMDATPQKYAYRCLPLQIANSNGWNALCPSELLVTYNGGQTKEDITIHSREPMKTTYCDSVFGAGIITFHLGYLITTEEENEKWDLHVSGSPNSWFDFMTPLTGIVESWWLPFTFTMNWKLTRPGTFTIPKNSIICNFFPVPHSYGRIQAEIKELPNNPKLEHEFIKWMRKRNMSIKAIEEIYEKGADEYAHMSADDISSQWEKTYYLGKDIKEHVTARKFPKFK